jgi:cobalt/nickel transport system permease protein
VKLAATLLFVAAVVATPREAMWAFGGHAALLAAAAAAARLPPGFVARRLVIEIPFLLFAVALPFFGRGERIDVLWLSLSREGLWGAWNILAKATLGAGASIVLAGTTQVPDLLRGFERLRMPRVLVSIMGFMIRYLDVVIGELQRMRIALRSRGYEPRGIGEARALAAVAGTLFIRSYERGERVYLAMLSRGFDGRMPDPAAGPAPAAQWMGAAAVAAAAGALAAAGWVLR